MTTSTNDNFIQICNNPNFYGVLHRYPNCYWWIIEIKTSNNWYRDKNLIYLGPIIIEQESCHWWHKDRTYSHNSDGPAGCTSSLRCEIGVECERKGRSWKCQSDSLKRKQNKIMRSTTLKMHKGKTKNYVHAIKPYVIMMRVNVVENVVNVIPMEYNREPAMATFLYPKCRKSGPLIKPNIMPNAMLVLMIVLLCVPLMFNNGKRSLNIRPEPCMMGIMAS